MTKKELNQYFWLKHEIERQRKRLERLNKRLQDYRDQGIVADTVRDYKSGKGIPVKIEGIAAEEFSLPITIKLLEEEIQKNIEESEKKMMEIEKYIQTIEDSKLREVMRSRFIDCLNWEDVGAANYIAPDYARALVREHLKVCKKCV